MLVGVCCECQSGGKPLRYERGRALIDSHDAFGSFCEGSGTAPQATYQDAAGSDQMPEGVQVVDGSSKHGSRSPGIYGTIGDILLAAKNGNKGKTKRGLILRGSEKALTR